MKICGKASEVSWWMEPSGGPLSTQYTPSEECWWPPLGFSKGKPLVASSVRPKAKIPGPSAPRFFGLWSGLGCGLGLAFKKSIGGPSIFSLGSYLSTLGNLPWDSIHHATTSPFPQIITVYSVQCPKAKMYMFKIHGGNRHWCWSFFFQLDRSILN